MKSPKLKKTNNSMGSEIETFLQKLEEDLGKAIEAALGNIASLVLGSKFLAGRRHLLVFLIQEVKYRSLSKSFTENLQRLQAFMDYRQVSESVIFEKFLRGKFGESASEELNLIREEYDKAMAVSSFLIRSGAVIKRDLKKVEEEKVLEEKLAKELLNNEGSLVSMTPVASGKTHPVNAKIFRG